MLKSLTELLISAREITDRAERYSYLKQHLKTEKDIQEAMELISHLNEVLNVETTDEDNFSLVSTSLDVSDPIIADALKTFDSGENKGIDFIESELGKLLFCIQRSMDTNIGLTLGGDFTLVELIGEGGFGRVYRAFQLTMNRPVAVKILDESKIKHSQSQAIIWKFGEEQKLCGLVNHDNLIRSFTCGTEEVTTGKIHWIAMELFNSTSIDQHLKSNSLTLERTLGLLLQVCEGVQHLHQKGLVHQDLSFSNVRVGTYEGIERIKVIDYGLANIPAWSMKKSKLDDVFNGAGTKQFCSPEQKAGAVCEIDTQSDIYSLGVILDLLTQEHQTTNRDLTEIVKKAKCVDRQERYRNVGEIQTDIKLLLNSKLLFHANSSPSRMAWSWAKSRIATFLLLLGAFLASGLFWISSESWRNKHTSLENSWDVLDNDLRTEKGRSENLEQENQILLTKFNTEHHLRNSITNILSEQIEKIDPKHGIPINYPLNEAITDVEELRRHLAEAPYVLAELCLQTGRACLERQFVAEAVQNLKEGIRVCDVHHDAVNKNTAILLRFYYGIVMVSHLETRSEGLSRARESLAKIQSVFEDNALDRMEAEIEFAFVQLEYAGERKSANSTLNKVIDSQKDIFDSAIGSRALYYRAMGKVFAMADGETAGPKVEVVNEFRNARSRLVRIYHENHPYVLHSEAMIIALSDSPTKIDDRIAELESIRNRCIELVNRSHTLVTLLEGLLVSSYLASDREHPSSYKLEKAALYLRINDLGEFKDDSFIIDGKLLPNGIVLYNTGIIFTRLGMSTTAMAFLSEAIPKLDLEGNTSDLIYAYNAQVTCLAHLNKFEEGEAIAKDLLQRIEKLDNQESKVVVTLDYAKLLRMSGDHETAIKILQGVLDNNPVNSLVQPIHGYILQEMGYLELLASNFEKAAQHLNGSLKKTGMHDTTWLMRSYRFRAVVANSLADQCENGSSAATQSFHLLLNSRLEVPPHLRMVILNDNADLLRKIYKTTKEDDLLKNMEVMLADCSVETEADIRRLESTLNPQSLLIDGQTGNSQPF